MGSVSSSFTIDIDLHNSLTNYCYEKTITKSYFIQKAVRALLEKEKIADINEYLNSLDDSQLEKLKKEIKKRE